MLLLMGCNYYESNLAGNKSINPEAQDPGQEDIGTLDEQIDFQQIKKRILDKNCINCHTGKHNNYDQYAIVKKAANDIVDRIGSKSFFTRMPKGRDPLSDDLISLFERWVDQGAPEFKVDNTNNSFSDYTFEEIKTFVFKPNQCLECHIDYEQHDVVVTRIDRIVDAIENGHPPQPTSMEIDTVTLKQYNMLIDWIELGLKEF